MPKKLPFALMAVLLAFLVSGCYSLKADMNVDSGSDTISGTATILIPSAYYNQPKVKGLLTIAPTPSVEVEPATAPGMEGMSLKFNRAPLEVLGGASLIEGAPKDAAPLATSLPFTISHVADEYLITGDFTAYFPSQATLQDRGITAIGNVADPSINVVLTFAHPIIKPVEKFQSAVKGNTLTLTTAFLKANPKFEFKVALPSKDVRKIDLSAPPETPSAYPLASHEPNLIPIYIFELIFLLAAAAVAYGYFGSGTSVTKRLRNRRTRLAAKNKVTSTVKVEKRSQKK